MPRETKQQAAIRDRERILAFFMQLLNSEIILRSGDLFEPTVFPEAKDLQPGDLVFLQSAPPTEWQLSWFVEMAGRYIYVLRTVGTGLLCNWSNVGFRIVHRSWLKSEALLEGWQRRAYETTMEALGRCDAYLYRFGGISFDGLTMTFTIRPHVWIGDAHPRFQVEIEKADNLSIKRAQAALTAGGVGTKFE